MGNKITDIKPQYNKNNDDFVDINTENIDLKKEVENLYKIIDKSKRINDKYKRDRFDNYAY